MNRIIGAFLTFLLSYVSHAADVTYRGPHSQMKVKLCSDTPPSRSLLPSGSMVCDDHPPRPDTQCTASWDYSEDDVFNCGSSISADDMNSNGIPDVEEDWDGDGTPNGSDPNPYESDMAEIDADGDGVPDLIQSRLDVIEQQRREVVYCKDGENNNHCTWASKLIDDLLKANQNLFSSFEYLAMDRMGQAAVDSSLHRLGDRVNSELNRNNRKIDEMYSLVEGVWRNTPINGGGDDYSDEFALIQDRFDDVDDSFYQAQVTSQANYRSLSDKLSRNSRSLKQIEMRFEYGFPDMQSKIDSIQPTIEGSISSLSDQINNIGTPDLSGVEQSISSLSSKIDGLDSPDLSSIENGISSLSDKIDGLDSLDLSSIENGISSLSDKIDGLGEINLEGVEGQLTDLINAVSNDANFSVSGSGFDGKGFLISRDQMTQIEVDIEQLEQEMTDEFEKFKALFSIDTSSFNDGTFKQHTLNLNINGSERSFKSRVFSALLDNAAIISAVIMFLFVWSGIRMLGKD